MFSRTSVTRALLRAEHSATDCGPRRPWRVQRSLECVTLMSRNPRDMGHPALSVHPKPSLTIGDVTLITIQ